jgi:hypothetical protein
MKWRIRVLTGAEAERQADQLRSVLRQYRLNSDLTRDEVGLYSVPVRDAGLAESIVADLGPAVTHAEVINSPE